MKISQITLCLAFVASNLASAIGANINKRDLEIAGNEEILGDKIEILEKIESLTKDENHLNRTVREQASWNRNQNQKAAQRRVVRRLRNLPKPVSVEGNIIRFFLSRGDIALAEKYINFAKERTHPATEEHF